MSRFGEPDEQDKESARRAFGLVSALLLAQTEGQHSQALDAMIDAEDQDALAACLTGMLTSLVSNLRRNGFNVEVWLQATGVALAQG